MSVYIEKIFGMFGRTASRTSDSVPGAVKAQSGSTIGGSISQEPVVVWEAANALEAQIILGRLESENIPAITQGEALGSIYGFTYGGLAKTEVLVPAPLAEKAILLLEEELFEVDDAADDDISDSTTDNIGEAPNNKEDF